MYQFLSLGPIGEKFWTCENYFLRSKIVSNEFCVVTRPRISQNFGKKKDNIKKNNIIGRCSAFSANIDLEQRKHVSHLCFVYLLYFHMQCGMDEHGLSVTA